ncbi:MAG: hypothetical protein N3D14_01305 [Aquificaceae bacterium]|nr:hypothetical protein [Aquificaceae bacterium]MCX8164015.1 hypothetical protein [Aquificaceae bacterium]
MIEYISRRKGEARLYFSSVEERNLFLRGMGGMEGVLGVDYKDNTRTLLIKFREGSFVHYLLENINSQKSLQKLDKEDLHFYLQPFLKHPAVKLSFSMLLLGWNVGLISFAVCSMFLLPYLKNKL